MKETIVSFIEIVAHFQASFKLKHFGGPTSIYSVCSKDRRNQSFSDGLCTRLDIEFS